MKRIIIAFLISFVFLSVHAFAQTDDVTIDQSGNLTTGTSATGNLEVTGGSAEKAIAGIASGTGGTGVYGENTSSGNEGYVGGNSYGLYGINTGSGNYGYIGSTGRGAMGFNNSSGNYGVLGDANYGVYGYSLSGDAGYFQGDAVVTGTLTVGTLVGESDPTVNDLGKATLSCSTDQIVRWNGSAWICSTDIDTDTTYSAGTGLNLIGTQFNLIVPLGLSGYYSWGPTIAGTNSDINGDSGVYGEYDGFGSGSGIHGVSSGGAGVYGQGNTGVLGEGWPGVKGTSDSGEGVRGESTTGIGGYFTSASGYGLIVENANVGIGTTTPGAVLDVKGNRGISATQDGIVNIGDTSSWHVTLDNNEISGRQGTNPSDLRINDFGGNVWIAQGKTLISSSGNVTSGNFVSSGDFQYASARTFYHMVQALEFDHADPTTDAHYVRYANNSFRHIVTGDFNMVAPVHLPQGADITELRCYYFDSTTSFNNSKYHLTAQNIETGVGGDIAYVTASSTGTAGRHNVVDTTVSGTGDPVDNSTYLYRILIDSHVVSVNPYQYGCRVTYTITQYAP